MSAWGCLPPSAEVPSTARARDNVAAVLQRSCAHLLTDAILFEKLVGKWLGGNIMQQEVLLKLFDIHHHQLEKRREKILFISRGSAAVFVALAGAVTAAAEKIAGWSVWIVICGILVFSMSACLKLYYDGRAYSEIAGVISRLNSALKLFQPLESVSNEAIYPSRWNKAMEVHPFQTVSHHCLLTAFAGLASSAFILQFAGL